MWGATLWFHRMNTGVKISTHTPHVGCDAVMNETLIDNINFNSHTPCGVRQVFHLLNYWKNNFNSHTPCGVRQGFRSFIITLWDFNSHTPCGVRLLLAVVFGNPWNFNSHTPCGVRPALSRGTTTSRKFQLTHPMRGATQSYKNVSILIRNFNSHTPCGVRP